jgi:uncharacterized repeat protein (TIGR01451 family)
LALWAGQVHGHSVAQVMTTKRIADPESIATVNTGDILTFIIQVTPFPNNATQGAGAYITEYIPGNTEVVGARLIDEDGHTVMPHRGPRMNDGYGPRARHDEFDGLGLLQGSMSAVYADTGIFYSSDPRTARSPDDVFLSVFNGIEIDPGPSGAGQLDQELGFTGPPYHAHNEWDRTQTLAFGVSGGTVGGDGRGNTPFGFGSPVAGQHTHYMFDVVADPECSDGINNDADTEVDYPNDPQCASALDDDETAASDAPLGPWQRIHYWGSEVGTGGNTDCSNCASDIVRVGVPTDEGWNLSPDNPLPPNTNAVRFAVGELIVGQAYFAEISLRVTGLPLDPAMNADANCAEVFGGDAAMPQNGQDNAWRYYVASPACVRLNLFFDLEADKLYAIQGDTVTYTLRGKNLSPIAQTNVVVTDSFVNGDLSFLGMLQGAAPTVTAGLLTWPAMSLAAGENYIFQWQMEVLGNMGSTLNQARYVSDALPAPGFTVSAMTYIEPLVVLAQAAAVSPTSTSAGSEVRYTVTLTNPGSGQADVDASSYIEVSLPAGFAYCAPPTCAQPTINTVGVTDPAIAGSELTFVNGLQAIAANGGTLVLEFSANVGGGVTPGQYTINARSRFDDNGVGREVEVSDYALAPLLVDVFRSNAPILFAPIITGATIVTGETSEGEGATITVFVNGNSVPNVFADFGGFFSATVPTLYQGQRISATARSAGEVESFRSSPEVIVAPRPEMIFDHGFETPP